jgi:hypothetical protein
MIEVVAVLVATGDRECAGADHVGETVHNARPIAPLGERDGELLGHPDAPVGHGKEHDAAIRCQATAVESSCDLLARDGWKRERKNRIVVHGECGVSGCARRLGCQQPNPTTRQ